MQRGSPALFSMSRVGRSRSEAAALTGRSDRRSAAVRNSPNDECAGIHQTPHERIRTCHFAFSNLNRGGAIGVCGLQANTDCLGEEVESFDAKISRSTNNRSVAWDGIDPNRCPEK